MSDKSSPNFTDDSLVIDFELTLRRGSREILSMKGNPEIPLFFHSSTLSLASGVFDQALEMFVTTPARASLNMELDRFVSELDHSAEAAENPATQTNGSRNKSKGETSLLSLEGAAPVNDE